MVRKLAFLLLFFAFSMGLDKIEISADKIFSDQKKGVIHINGNVIIKKGKDVLYANKASLKADKDKKPIEYQAIGNVRFRVTLQNARVMKGNADKIIYNAIKDEYQLIGKAYVKEEGKDNAIKGDTIILNKKDGSSSVAGSRKKPAKITFTLDKKDE